MNKIFPKKLQEGDEIRVISPSSSLTRTGKFEDKLKALRAIKKKEHNVKNQKNIIDDMIDYIINDRYKDYKNLILELEKVDLDVISNK